MNQAGLFLKNPLAKAFWSQESVPECPIYDMHCHMGENNAITFPLAGIDRMVAHMERINAKIVFCHHWALFTPDFTNEECYEIARQYAERMRIYIAINPHYPELIQHDIEMYDKWRDLAIGFKILPDYHLVQACDKRYTPILERANADGSFVLFHTWGGSNFNGPDQLRQVVEKYPNARFIIGHCFNNMFDDAIRLCNDHPDHVFLELTSIPGRSGAIEKLVQGAGSNHILFGTDMPWFDYYQAVGGIVGAKISEDDMHNILHRNAQRILPGF